MPRYAFVKSSLLICIAARAAFPLGAPALGIPQRWRKYRWAIGRRLDLHQGRTHLSNLLEFAAAASV
jgi:hypothetical protein